MQWLTSMTCCGVVLVCSLVSTLCRWARIVELGVRFSADIGRKMQTLKRLSVLTRCSVLNGFWAFGMRMLGLCRSLTLMLGMKRQTVRFLCSVVRCNRLSRVLGCGALSVMSTFGSLMTCLARFVNVGWVVGEWDGLMSDTGGARCNLRTAVVVCFLGSLAADVFPGVLVSSLVILR